jgi:hypothetical protein
VAELKAFESALGVAERSQRIDSYAAQIINSGDIAEARSLAEKIIGEL